MGNVEDGVAVLGNDFKEVEERIEEAVDAMGRVVKPVTDKVNNAYSKTVGNRSAQVVKKPQQKLQPDAPKPAKIDAAELLPEELELDESLEDDLEVEKIKEEEIKKATKKK